MTIAAGETVLCMIDMQEKFAPAINAFDACLAASTKLMAAAKEMGVKTARNDVFLDNSKDIEEIRAQVYKAIKLAEENGSAIAICHARPATVAMWEKYANEFRKSGVKFVHVTEVLY